MGGALECISPHSMLDLMHNDGAMQTINAIGTASHQDKFVQHYTTVVLC